MKHILTAVLTAIGAIALVAVLMALPTMFLWNWLMPSIFGLTKIGFFKALGINLFAGILFNNSKSNNNG